MKNRQRHKAKKASLTIFAFICLITLIMLTIMAVQPIVCFAKNEGGATDNDIKSYSEYIDDIIDSLNLEGLDEFYQNSGLNLNGKTFKDLLIAFIDGKSIASDNISKHFTDVIFSTIKNILPTIIAVFIISILSEMFKCSSSGTRNVDETVFLVCYASASSILFTKIASFSIDIINFIKQLSGIMQGAFPIFATISGLSGETNKVGLLTPVYAFISQTAVVTLTKLLIPCILVVCSLSAVSSISDRFSLSKLRDTIIDCFKWVVGIAISILSFYTTASGVSGAVKDGTVLRAVKYTIGNTVPVIGGFAKEGVEVALTALKTIKSSTGILFLMITTAYILKPLIELIGVALMLKLLSALSSPFADKRLSDMLVGFQKTVSMLTVLLISTLILFFVLTYSILFLQIGG